MKILIVQDFLRSGGTERQSVLLANAFAAAGHDTTLLTFRPGGPLESNVASGVARRVLQNSDLGIDWFAPRLHATVAALAPDTVLCMGRMANCYAGRLQQRLRSSAVVSTMRTGKPLPWLFRRSLRLVRHIVANSRDARDVLVGRHKIEPARITVIHNSLVFRPASNEIGAKLARLDWRDRCDASPTTLVLLSVAMFRPEKNQRELIEIAAGLPPTLDWQLWLAGDGPSRDPCASLVRDRSLESRVKFLGLVPDPSSLYAAADVAVHASASESLSNFLIEAQAHGLPAVAYQAQGIAECFVPDHTGWIIARGDHAGFRAALERLAGGEHAALAAEARAYARATFDPARQVAAYLDLFTTLRS